MIVMYLQSGWLLCACNRLLSCGDGDEAVAAFSQHARLVVLKLLVVDYCDDSVRDKDGRCRKRRAQAT